MTTWSDKAQQDLITYSKNAPPPHGRDNLSLADHTKLKHAVERWADQIGEDQASNRFDIAGAPGQTALRLERWPKTR